MAGLQPRIFYVARLLVAGRQQRGETPRKVLYFRLVSNFLRVGKKLYGFVKSLLNSLCHSYKMPVLI